MRPTRSRWLAASSSTLGAALLLASLLVLLAAPAAAATRPHYGGTLRIQTQAAVTSLAPPAPGDPPNALAEQLARLLYDTRHSAAAGATPAAGKIATNNGPFRVVEFVPGKKLTLAANDDYAGGRPFLDGIEIQMARPAREQMVAFQLGRADEIDVPVETMRRASSEGVRLAVSSPVELVAIVFSANSNVDARVRQAVSLTVDRAAIFNVLLGRQGEPSAALLPDWLTGYSFLFDAAQNVTRARQLAIDAGRARPITLTYDPQDPLARAIAERIALDARAAGLSITPTTSLPTPDARLVRITFPTADPCAALAMLAAALGPPAALAPLPSDPQALYQAERGLRDELRVVPLLHLPLAYGVATRVKGWAPDRAGSWSLADVWLEPAAPKEQKP